MVKEYLLRCDRCDKAGSAKNPVHAFAIRRDDDEHFQVDLCAKCWSAVESDAVVQPVIRNVRRGMEVVDPQDIPKTP